MDFEEDNDVLYMSDLGKKDKRDYEYWKNLALKARDPNTSKAEKLEIILEWAECPSDIQSKVTKEINGELPDLSKGDKDIKEQLRTAKNVDENTNGKKPEVEDKGPKSYEDEYGSAANEKLQMLQKYSKMPHEKHTDEEKKAEYEKKNPGYKLGK